MEKVPLQTRQLLGCGYEPPPSESLRMFVRPWTGCGVEPKPSTDTEPAFPSVCPGYSTSLPEVIEGAIARSWWKNGELTQFCRGQATEALSGAINVVDNEINAMQVWVAENPLKKAGA